MANKDDSPKRLIEIIDGGWTPTHYGRVEELIQVFAKKLHTTAEIKEVDSNVLRFVIDLSDIRLKGMRQVPCLLLIGKDSANTATAVEKFWREENAPGRRIFVLTLSDLAYKQAQASLPKGEYLILTKGQIEQLLDADDSRMFLKRCILQQIPKQKLIPYNILLPVEGGMFFGRENELNRLRYEEDVSFAILGSSRMGKTSLVKQYKYQMVRERAPRLHCRFYITFYDCKDKTDNGVAKHIAMKIQPSSRSNRITAKDLVNFLLYQTKRLGGPLDLILDEVDEVCQSEAFQSLGSAARDGRCRLVLCGKGVLLKMLLQSTSSLGCRLELIRLGPLEEDAARALLLDPLADLGFHANEPEQLVEEVLRLTGRLPHLIQFYGKKLASLAIKENTDTISMNHVDIIKSDFETFQYFISCLNDLPTPETYLVALVILEKQPPKISAPEVQALAVKEGLSLDYASVVDMCNELVINNVLAWSNGTFRIVNEALPDYARQLGFLGQGLMEARRAVKSR